MAARRAAQHDDDAPRPTTKSGGARATARATRQASTDERRSTDVASRRVEGASASR